MTTEELEREIARQLDSLREELADSPLAQLVGDVGREHFVMLSRNATIPDFLPLLVYRFTREELIHGTRARLHVSA